jgi:ABC-type branched-subunit amino acid transport system substrate-binding protein
MFACHKHPLVILVVLSCLGCEAWAGGETRDAGAAVITGECLQHADCAKRQALGSATFCTTKNTCQVLRSEDCALVSGSEGAAHSIVVGTLYATTGSAAADNTARQNAVQLAVEEINDGGGVPAPQGGGARMLLLVGCDATRDPLRAAKHLMDLGALAVIGPAERETASNVLVSTAAMSGSVLFSPAAITADADEVFDADLGWSMAPTIEQRAPLVNAALAGLASELSAQRARPLKLAVLYRDDLWGRAHLTSLQRQTFDGESLMPPLRANSRARFDRMPTQAADRASMVAAYRVFAPDVIVLFGGPEVVNDWIAPLEQSLQTAAAATEAARPYYLLTEAAKGRELVTLTQRGPALRSRVRGIASAPTERAKPLFESFQRHYDSRFGDRGSVVPGAGASYDALYALANALARAPQDGEQAVLIAQSLHTLSAAERLVPVGPVKVSSALNLLADGELIAALGVMGPLRWDEFGRIRTGSLEVWCLRPEDGPVPYGSTGQSFDLATQTLAGQPLPCGAAPAAGMPKTDLGPSFSVPAGGAGGSSPAPAVPPQADSAAVATDAGMLTGGSGSADVEGPTTADPPPITPRNISCGDQPCAVDRGESCCVARTQTWLGPTTVMSCVAPNVWDLLGPSMCTLTLGCSSDKSCPPNDVCCMDGGRSQCVSSATCSQTGGRRLACDSPHDCPPGKMCCLYGHSPLTTRCEQECSALRGAKIVCDELSDCPPRLLASCDSSASPSNVKLCNGI